MSQRIAHAVSAATWVAVAVVACSSDTDRTADPGGSGGGTAADAGPPPGPIPPPAQCGEPTATSYYVSPVGDDANPGTLAAPWQTLEHAAAAAEPGDTVYLGEGTYEEPLVVPRSGTAGNYITFAALDPQARPIIDGVNLPNQDGGLVEIAGHSYVKLCNLTVRNAAEHGVRVVSADGVAADHVEVLGLAVENSGQAAIYFEGVSESVIEHNVTRYSVSSGIGVWYSQQIAVRDNEVVNARYDEERGHEESISISGTADFEVTGNEVYLADGVPCTGGNAAIKAKEGSERGRMCNNYVHDFYPEGHISLDAWDAGLNGTPTLNTIDICSNLIVSSGGIRLSSEEDGIVENIDVYNNVVLFTDNGIMITDAGSGGPRRNINIFNNTVYEGNDEWFMGINVMTLNADAIVIRNNIVASSYNTARIGLISAALTGRVTADHNLVFGPKRCFDSYPDCVELSDLPGNTTADPLFVDGPAGDVHLRLGSPAIDQGIEIPGLTDDFDGASRPQGAQIDIGAFEQVPR